ncbi:hypothetical protein [Streptomyces sp. 5-10]|uniref:hypothetical protein n=1 Tax=Streptomyces sp. 5-10 TaxID=878925 RepID=UPI00168BDE01|nr:hypothetical protein [Streptomyces sp. 5-10]MBD3004630.1 hypothetical protein [Streptomyces sp. 5-10]
MSDPHAEYKIQKGPLAGQYRQTIETLYRNVALAAHDSTPGAPVNDYENGDPRKPFTRPLTESEAADSREGFGKLCKQLEAREPEVYAAWRERYLDWKSGDLSERLIRPDEVASGLKGQTET